jgi:hypothetical protein
MKFNPWIRILLGKMVRDKSLFLSFPPRIKYGVNSGGNPIKSKRSGLLLEFIPMKIGIGVTGLRPYLHQKAHLPLDRWAFLLN